MIKDFFKSDEVRIALVAGFCIIAMAILFKKILHIEVDSWISNSPGYLVILYLLGGAGKKGKRPGWKLWSLIIIAFAIIAVVVNVV